jgi:hypothetical protein
MSFEITQLVVYGFDDNGVVVCREVVVFDYSLSKVFGGYNWVSGWIANT